MRNNGCLSLGRVRGGMTYNCHMTALGVRLILQDVQCLWSNRDLHGSEQYHVAAIWLIFRLEYFAI